MTDPERELPAPVRVRIIVRPSARLIAAIKTAFAFFMAVVALGTIVDGFEDVGDGETVFGVGKIAIGILGAPFATWVGLSTLRAVIVARASITIDPEGFVIRHSGIFRKPVRVERPQVAAVSFDDRRARFRRSREHARFDLAGEPAGAEPDHLYSRAGGAPFPILSQVAEVPNTAIVFTEPRSLSPTRRWMELFPARSSVHPPIHNRRSRGLLVRLRDVDAGRRGFEPWGVVRDLSHGDMELLRPTEADRLRLKRVAFVDGIALLALFFFAFVLPIVTADPLEGPILSPGVGVCRQMAESLHDNPSGSAAVEPPALLDNGITDAVDDSFVLIDGGPMELADDPTSDRLRDAGFVRGFSGRWVSPRGELFIEVTVLGDAGEAEDYNSRVLGETCTEANEVFDVSAVPGAVGLRWFTNQGLVDQISFASDEVHVFVAIADEDDEPDRRAAVTTAEGVAGFLLRTAPL